MGTTAVLDNSGPKLAEVEGLGAAMTSLSRGSASQSVAHGDVGLDCGTVNLATLNASAVLVDSFSGGSLGAGGALGPFTLRSFFLDDCRSSSVSVQSSSCWLHLPNINSTRFLSYTIWMMGKTLLKNYGKLASSIDVPFLTSCCSSSIHHQVQHALVVVWVLVQLWGLSLCTASSCTILLQCQYSNLIMLRTVPEIILRGAHFFQTPPPPGETWSQPPRPPGHVSALINPPHYGSNTP